MKKYRRLRLRMGQVQRPAYSGVGTYWQKTVRVPLPSCFCGNDKKGSCEGTGNEPTPYKTSLRAKLDPARPWTRPGSDTFGSGDVAETDLGWLIAVLIGAFPAGAGSRGGRPATGCHVLWHGKLAGSARGQGGRMDADSGSPRTNATRPPPSRTFQKAAQAPGRRKGGERGLPGGAAPS